MSDDVIASGCLAILVAGLLGLGMLVWAFNVNEDRDHRNNLEELIVTVCTGAESPKRCADGIREAL